MTNKYKSCWGATALSSQGSVRLSPSLKLKKKKSYNKFQGLPPSLSNGLGDIDGHHLFSPTSE